MKKTLLLLRGHRAIFIFLMALIDMPLWGNAQGCGGIYFVKSHDTYDIVYQSDTSINTGGITYLNVPVTNQTYQATWQNFYPLPPGMTVSSVSAEAIVSGTPTKVGSYTFSIQNNGEGGYCKSEHAVIINVHPVVTMSSHTNVSCNGGSNGSATVTVSGGGGSGYNYTWSPSGGTAPTATGLVAGNYTCVVTDVASGLSNVASVTITQPDAPFVFTTTSLPVGTYAIPYNQTIVATGGTGNIGYTITQGNLPNGITMDGGNGALSGSSTSVGNHKFVVTATDENGCTQISKLLNLGIKSIPDANGILYVDSANLSFANPSGSSWGSAIPHLSDALSVAALNSSVKEIHVAKGTYYPTGAQNSTDRSNTFIVSVNGLGLYGGYPTGGGTRDLKANLTTLNGDIGNPGDNSDNSYHVMTIVAPASDDDGIVVDGFNIIGGNANDGGSTDIDGIANLRNDGGGGIVIYSCGKAGVVCNLCEVSGNKATISGGGILDISMGIQSQLYLSNCTIKNNQAIQGGGGLSVLTGSTTVINSIFNNNTSIGIGGGIYNFSSSLTLTNVTISGNIATANGGGIYNLYGSPTQILNNSIVLGNSTGLFDGNLSAYTTTVTGSHNLIQTGDNNSAGAFDGATVPTATAANVFVAPQAPGLSTAEDYSLKTGSYAIDKGDNSLFPGLDTDTKDLAGNPRLIGGTIDLGAYEFQEETQPLKLISFTAVKDNNNVLLTWQTATESNTDYFEIERSTDGKTYTGIGKVQAAGNSLVTQNYSFTDINPADGNNFYQLRMIDQDEKFTYSPVAQVRFTGALSWILSPNPATSKITLHASKAVNSNTIVNVYTVNGKLVADYNIAQGARSLDMDVSRLAQGSYYLWISNADLRKTIPFVKR